MTKEAIPERDYVTFPNEYPYMNRKARAARPTHFGDDDITKDDFIHDRTYRLSNRSMVFSSQYKRGTEENVKKKNNGICFICGVEIDDEEFSIDHVISCVEMFNEYAYRLPQSKRNELYSWEENLMPVHLLCNSAKGGRHQTYDQNKVTKALRNKSTGTEGWEEDYSEWIDSLR